MKRLNTVALAAGAVMVAGIPASGQAADFFDGHVSIDGFAAQHAQLLQARGTPFVAEDADKDFGFTRIRFGLGIGFTVTEGVSGYFEISEEPEDFGAGGGAGEAGDFRQDLGWIDLNVGQLMGAEWANDNDFIIRPGEIVTLLWNFRGYSDGGAVQANPLIGNGVSDYVTGESGIQILGSHRGLGFGDAINWDIWATSPTFTEDFGGGTCCNFGGRFSVNISPEIAVGAGWLMADLSDQIDNNRTLSAADPGSAGAIKGTATPNGDGDPHNMGGVGPAGQPARYQGLLPGIAMSAYQFDFQLEPSFVPGLLVRGWVNYAEDDYSFVTSGVAGLQSAPGNAAVVTTAADQSVAADPAVVRIANLDAELLGWGIEASYYVIPDSIYVAARYTGLDNLTSGVTGNTLMDRIQIGAGWWIADGTLLKAEYMYQNEGNNSAGNIGADWSGFSTEIGVVF